MYPTDLDPIELPAPTPQERTQAALRTIRLEHDRRLRNEHDERIANARWARLVAEATEGAK